MIVFLLSCSQEPQSSELLSESEQDVAFLLSNYWEGEGSIQDQQYVGEERIYYSKGGLPEGRFNCILYFDVFGEETNIGECPSCVFAFQMEAEIQEGLHVVDDGTCSDYSSESKSFHYAYTDDYQGHGPSLLYYSYDYFQWFAWIRDGDDIYGTEQVVEYDSGNARFNYKGGFLYYFYEFEQ